MLEIPGAWPHNICFTTRKQHNTACQPRAHQHSHPKVIRKMLVATRHSSYISLHSKSPSRRLNMSVQEPPWLYPSWPVVVSHCNNVLAPDEFLCRKGITVPMPWLSAVSHRYDPVLQMMATRQCWMLVSCCQRHHFGEVQGSGTRGMWFQCLFVRIVSVVTIWRKDSPSCDS